MKVQPGGHALHLVTRNGKAVLVDSWNEQDFDCVPRTPPRVWWARHVRAAPGILATLTTVHLTWFPYHYGAYLHGPGVLDLLALATGAIHSEHR